MELIHNNSYSIDIHKYQRFCLSHTDHAGWNIHPDCWKVVIYNYMYYDICNMISRVLNTVQPKGNLMQAGR